MKDFSELTQQELLALAIALEEEDNRGRVRGRATGLTNSDSKARYCGRAGVRPERYHNKDTPLPGFYAETVCRGRG